MSVTTAEVDALINRENVSDTDLTSIISTAEAVFEMDAKTTYEDSNKEHHAAVLFLVCHLALRKETQDYITKDQSWSREKKDQTDFQSEYKRRVRGIRTATSRVLE